MRQQWFETKTLKSPIALCHVHNVVGYLWICSFNFVSVLSVGMPSIRPLETLHNSLSLRQLDAFLEYVTATIFKTPCPSPRLRSPLRSNPFVFLATCDKGPSINKVGNWKGREDSKFGQKSQRMVPKNCQHGGGCVKNPKIFADVVYGWSPIRRYYEKVFWQFLLRLLLLSFIENT